MPHACNECFRMLRWTPAGGQTAETPGCVAAVLQAQQFKERTTDHTTNAQCPSVFRGFHSGHRPSAEETVASSNSACPRKFH